MSIICIRCGEKMPKEDAGEDKVCPKCREERTKNGKKSHKKKVGVLNV
jgi:NMD protein affecting ribosome stability and mRNA decay